MSENQVNHKFKTIIIGNTGVGKSTLLLRYVEGQYIPQKMTIGIDYRYKNVSYQGNSFKLELWDTAGQERYRTIVYNYFKLSKAGVIVFDINQEKSFDDAKMWMQQLNFQCGNQIPKILLGNKSDKLNPERLKQYIDRLKPEIDKLSEQFSCKFFVVSALTGENINQAFQYLIKQIFRNNKPTAQTPVKDSKFMLSKKSNSVDTKRQKKGCC